MGSPISSRVSRFHPAVTAEVCGWLNKRGIPAKAYRKSTSFLIWVTTPRDEWFCNTYCDNEAGIITVRI